VIAFRSSRSPSRARRVGCGGGHPHLGHFRDGRAEPFFLKSPENVQGDEREAVILSVGCGPNEATGTASVSFGPPDKKNVGR
jgi:hypothetical protein